MRPETREPPIDYHRRPFQRAMDRFLCLLAESLFAAGAVSAQGAGRRQCQAQPDRIGRQDSRRRNIVQGTLDVRDPHVRRALRPHGEQSVQYLRGVNGVPNRSHPHGRAIRAGGPSPLPLRARSLGPTLTDLPSLSGRLADTTRASSEQRRCCGAWSARFPFRGPRLAWHSSALDGLPENH